MSISENRNMYIYIVYTEIDMYNYKAKLHLKVYVKTSIHNYRVIFLSIYLYQSIHICSNVHVYMYIRMYVQTGMSASISEYVVPYIDIYVNILVYIHMVCIRISYSLSSILGIAWALQRWLAWPCNARHLEQHWKGSVLLSSNVVWSNRVDGH